MSIRRARPPAVMSDVVRARLDELMADLQPRRALQEDAPAPRPSGPAPDPEDAPAGARRLAAPVVFGPRHAAVLAVLGVLGLTWAAWSVLGTQTVPVAEAAPTPVLTAAPASTPTPEPRLRVHVLGAVVEPGVVSLPPGARVEDALAAAGGLAPGARPGELNLAAPVADGAQIVVGTDEEPGGELRGAEVASSSGGAAAGVLDLNSATAAQLEALPGVGPVTAAAILAWRAEHQRFSRVEELQEVDGIGPRTFERLAPHVRV